MFLRLDSGALTNVYFFYQDETEKQYTNVQCIYNLGHIYKIVFEADILPLFKGLGLSQIRDQINVNMFNNIP